MLYPMGVVRAWTARRVLIGLYVEKCRYEEILGGYEASHQAECFLGFFCPMYDELCLTDEAF